MAAGPRDGFPHHPAQASQGQSQKRGGRAGGSLGMRGEAQHGRRRVFTARNVLQPPRKGVKLWDHRPCPPHPLPGPAPPSPPLAAPLCPSASGPAAPGKLTQASPLPAELWAGPAFWGSSEPGDPGDLSAARPAVPAGDLQMAITSLSHVASPFQNLSTPLPGGGILVPARAQCCLRPGTDV